MLVAQVGFLEEEHSISIFPLSNTLKGLAMKKLVHLVLGLALMAGMVCAGALSTRAANHDRSMYHHKHHHKHHRHHHGYKHVPHSNSLSKQSW